MNSPSTSRIARLGLLTGLLAACALLMAATASSASAQTVWRITSAHGPTHMPTNGPGEYVIEANNIGTSDSEGLITVTDHLPAGVSATSTAAGVNGSWECSGTTFPTPTGATVTCTTEDVVPAPTLHTFPSFVRGMGNALYIFVTDEGASGTSPNEVEVSGGAAEPASATDPTVFNDTPAGFGLIDESFKAAGFDAAFPAGAPVDQAGAHPFEQRFDFDFNLRRTELPETSPNPFTEPEGRVRTTETELPDGFVGNPEATPKCTNAQLIQVAFFAFLGSCPPATQIGTIDLITNNGNELFTIDQPNLTTDLPIYNMVPAKGAVADFGFVLQSIPVHLISRLDPTDHYRVITTASDVTEAFPLRSARVTLWGVPADPAHDALRFHPSTTNDFSDLSVYGTPSGTPRTPLLTLPSQCDTPGSTKMTINSWEEPANKLSYEAEPQTQTGCDKQAFAASISAQPTTNQADSPSGLAVDVNVPQDLNVPGLGTPPLREATVTLPEGMSVNPASADGLGGCTAAQISLGTNDPVACPDSAKIGSVKLTTPLLPEPIGGSIYLAKPFENPSGGLLALYIVISDPERGLLIKLPGSVQADPQTGRLTTTFADNPQIPFSNLHVELKGGSRAALRTPSTCGAYTTQADLTSWNSSLPAVSGADSFQVSSGPGGGPCPNGKFDPTLRAGAQIPIAGAFSPFVLKLSREDGSQQFASLSATLPPGMLGKLAGIPYCPDSALAAIPTATGTGAAQLANPSCPSASRLGTVSAGAGAGSTPFYVSTGRAYLAGPYKGAPLSLAIVTPALAGPFDLGNVLVRTALRVDPTSAQITAVSDPIPSILDGIPLDLRSIEVNMDRNQFTLNPTSCDPMSVGGTATSLGGASAALSDRFQVGACGALGFKPKLALSLKGGTRRSMFPALRATLKVPAGGANIARAQVSLPHSEFLAQSHIRTICTRAQFAASQCPAKSIYGHARAVTPLLDHPLEGPVYLRSSSHQLPDLVADLNGQIHVVLDGRIDSVGGGIRNTFEVVPDAPVSKFTLTMQGGKKGLLENSTDLCNSTARAKARFVAHNGKSADLAPVVRPECGKRGKKGRAKSNK